MNQYRLLTKIVGSERRSAHPIKVKALYNRN